MALVTFGDYPCRLISPSVVLDHRLDGDDLAWVRDHLRRCEACRKRVDRERLRRESRLRAVTTSRPRHRSAPTLTFPLNQVTVTSERPREQAKVLANSVRPLVSAGHDRLAQSRWLALVVLMGAMVGAFFVSSSPRLAADAEKQIPASARLAAGSVEPSKPSTEPSPSATSEPSTLPATSQDQPVLTVVVPSPRATHGPPPPPPPPAVSLRTTLLSGVAPWTVTADASGSTDPSGIASYEFHFAGGIVIRPLLGATASYTYCQPGHYTLTVIVTNKLGISASAFVYVDVIPPLSPSC